MSVVPFDLDRRFIRPCAVLRGVVSHADGSQAFWIDYLFHESEGSGTLCIWYGIDYAEALSELLTIQKQEMKVYETAGGTRG